jgi:pimeloyl-ACP methyl ester carboxylesterase
MLMLRFHVKTYKEGVISMFRLLKLSTFWAIVVGLAFSFTAFADTPEIYVYYDGPLGQRIPLILIHGLWAETQSECFNETWATFVEGFIQAELNRFYQLYCFEYPSESMGVERAAEWLAYRLDQYLPRHQVVIVAHSMGGLVARAYMNLKGGGSRVIKLITLATPHHGTPLASLFSIFRRVGKEELQSQAELPRFIPQAIRDDITSLFIVPLTSSDLLWLNRIAWLAEIWGAVSPATLQDLEWDSFDGFSAVIPSSLRADFTNPFLDRLNAIVDYDSKIIAYYGGLTVWQLIYWRDPLVTWLDVAIPDTRYGVLGSIIATLKGNFSIYSNDGLVPISSGGFEGHLIAKRVFFEGMNHSDMRENPVVISKLVSELWDIVRTLPPPTPRFSLLQATLSASEVRPGQEVFVSIQIQNTGETAGTVSLRLRSNGELIVEESRFLIPGEIWDVEYAVRFPRAGTYTITMDADPAPITIGQVQVAEPSPPPPPPSPSGGIVISIEATATRVMPNQEIIVRARITNNGATYFTTPVPFTVDGKAVMTSNLSIAPGRTEILEFKISFTADQAGTHTIAVGDSPPLTIYVEGPSVSKTPEQFFDSNGNGRLDDSEILTALDYWIKQRPVPDIGVLSDLQILSLLDKWIKGTRIAGQ